MSTYLDSSFVVSLYGPDNNLVRAASTLRSATAPLLVSTLCEFEATNAFRLRVFRKDASAGEAQRSIKNLERDLATGVLERRQLPEETFTQAHRVSAQFTILPGIRGAGLLLVAAALELGPTDFFSFDQQQRKLANELGFNLNPI